TILGDEQHNEKPAKVMREKGKVINFGGELHAQVDGLTPAQKRDLRNLIDGQATLAEEKAPGNRVISIKSGKDGIHVYTEKNLLAVSIGKKIHQAFKGGILTITYSHHNHPARVLWAPKH